MPLSLSVGVGKPVVVTVKRARACPIVNDVVLLALVIAGAWAAATVSVKLWVALGGHAVGGGEGQGVRAAASPPPGCR